MPINNKSNYKISEELSDDGWFSDDTGVYVPYTYKKEKYYDPRRIYLKIHRIIGGLVYTIGKLENGLFYPMESYTSPELISETDKSLNRQILYAGNRCSLNSKKGAYANLVKSTKDEINGFDGLAILKEEDYDFSRPVIANFTVNPTSIHHNFMDMWELTRISLNQEPKKHYSYYDMFLCPFHDDHKPSARVFKHVFQCYKYKERQLDQTEFLKLLYGLKSSKEVELKFQSLINK